MEKGTPHPPGGKATVLPQWVGRDNLSLSTPDASDISELYHRWAGPYDDLTEDGNGLFSVGDATGDVQVTGHIWDWGRMDLDGFPGYLGEFGISRFIRTRGSPRRSRSRRTRTSTRRPPPWWTSSIHGETRPWY